MGSWILPTISELIGKADPNAPAGSLSAEQGWRGAITASAYMLQSYIQSTVDSNDVDTPCWHMDGEEEAHHSSPSPDEMRLKTTQGLILTGPLPVFDCPQILEHFSSWVFSVPTWQSLWQLPADIGSVFAEEIAGRTDGTGGGDRPNRPITLLPADPLGRECFALILLPHFSLALVCEHADDGTPINFQFSFSPGVIEQAWQSLRARIAITSGHHLKRLDNLVEQFAPVEPRYDTVMEFGQLMWRAMPASSVSTPAKSDCIGESFSVGEKNIAEKNGDVSKAVPINAAYEAPDKGTPDSGIFGSDDVAFLRAFAHGIRTPLTTIRTYTRLLQRKDLAADVQRHLDKIDRECSEQIDRFDLIFKAVENETCDGTSTPNLHPFCLKKMIAEGQDRWQRQADRHNLTFAVSAPPLIPPIAGDCDLLDQMLTELIETLIRSLPANSHIDLNVIPAGDRLKLELVCEDARHQDGGWLGWGHSSFQAIGRLLAFQPETGSVSLNLDVTKNLFQSIGGKLTVRHSPQHGDVVTIFLPVDNTPATLKTSKTSWFV
ncbi:MAG: HAMP domain-containing sensor histidine kinase [Cyanobacteria bacterium P01_C01_bin.89]